MNRPIRSWAGQRVWVIGASSGIGAAVAQHALQAGAKVILSARRVSQLHHVANNHALSMVIPLDVLDSQAWKMAYEDICAQWGGVDLLVFCAADYHPERSWDVSMASAEVTLRVNVMSVYGALETVLPSMLTRGSGGFAIVASVAGYIGLPNASVYGPSKAALINLAEILYSDLHARGLNVYLINPGFVKTELTSKNDFFMPALQTPQQAAEAIWRGISAGRFEIHFPRRFTFFMKMLQLCPYRLRLAVLAHTAKAS